MSKNRLALEHLVRKPGGVGQAPPPLLLLLHGVGSNEEDLFALAPYLDARFLVVSARAPVALDYGGYGWFRIEFTPSGMVADEEQARKSLRLLPGFVFSDRVDTVIVPPKHGDSSGVRGAAWLWSREEAAAFAAGTASTASSTWRKLGRPCRGSGG